MDKTFDEKLVRKAYGLISKKYSTENGKKFILHLISSFVLNDKEEISFSNGSDLVDIECCITRVKITPKNSPVPSESRYYGFKSSKSDKFLCNEAMEALDRFIMNRSINGDNVISRIEKYINKKDDKKVTKLPSSKNSYPKNKKIKKSNASYVEIQAIPSPNEPTA
jgi:hypothetical protein